jgi:hypothetical protein
MIQLIFLFQVYGISLSIPFSIHAHSFVNGQVKISLLYPQRQAGLQVNLTFAGIPIAWRIGS